MTFDSGGDSGFNIFLSHFPFQYTVKNKIQCTIVRQPAAIGLSFLKKMFTHKLFVVSLRNNIFAEQSHDPIAAGCLTIIHLHFLQSLVSATTVDA